MNSESRLPYDYERGMLLEVDPPGVQADPFEADSVEASPVLDQGEASVAHCGPAAAEELRRLAQSIALSAHAGQHVLAFCGVTGADRSELVCMRAAELLAFSFGYGVCVLDANPSTAPPTRMGWVTGNPSKIMRLSRPPSRGTGSLSLLGKNQVASFLHTGARGDLLRERLSDLRQSFDYVLISAPRPRDSRFTAVASQVDGVILAVEAGSARRGSALRAKRTIEAAQGRLIGTVLTERRFPIPQWLFELLAT